MKTILLLLLLLPAFTQAQDSLWADQGPDLFAQSTTPHLGKPFSPFQFIKSDGQTLSNEMLKGKVVLISFWKESCFPCLAELGAFEELYQTLKSDTGFLFLSFTSDSRTKTALLREKYKFTFPVIPLPEDSVRQLHFSTGYPGLMLLNRDSRIIQYVVGGTTDTQQARKTIMNTYLPDIRKELLK